MKVYLSKPKCNVFAEGIFDAETGCLIVKKGAKVSKDVRNYASCSAEKTICMRKDIVEDGILVKDFEFKSPSGAGLFVTGRSTNGMVAWKDEEGRTLNEIMGKDFE